MRAKKQTAGLLILILILVGSALTSSCTVKKIDPYTMNETEALVWLKENDIAIPPEIDGIQIGKLVVDVVKGHQAGLDMSAPISYEVTARFIQAIQYRLDHPMD